MSNETISALQVALDMIRDETRELSDVSEETMVVIATIRGLIKMGLAGEVVG